MCGFCVFLGSNLVSWSAKKQPTVARSSTEAEYRSLAYTAAEVTWICKVFRDFGFSSSVKPTIWCDNISAISLASNPVFNAISNSLLATSLDQFDDSINTSKTMEKQMRRINESVKMGAKVTGDY
ncbi:unnamed protein product [Prunus armeniaca]|uniref:Reverse transcriptase Ty1/copia-type domain-containing protein n=1 Tax=Prunus armeniaca TaxID=36596 RepID=A0A6J5UMZ0_PRUAR|nr:unnamed protein product [Prunus armeniaca]